MVVRPIFQTLTVAIQINFGETQLSDQFIRNFQKAVRYLGTISFLISQSKVVQLTYHRPPNCQNDNQDTYQQNLDTYILGKCSCQTSVS